jgi:amino acid adenylation domain-containing protein
MWISQQSTAHPSAYNEGSALRLWGPMDRARLERSLAGVVARHDALRCAIEMIDGAPMVARREPFEVPVPLTDLGGLPVGAREAALEDGMREAMLPAFDLAAGPPLRARLFRLDEEEHVLLLAVHHVVCDEHSMAVLWRDLAQFYAGAPPAGEAGSFFDHLPVAEAAYPPARQESDLAHWLSRLSGAPALLELPPLRGRPLAGPAVSTVARRLPAELPPALLALCRRTRTSPYMVGLAAFAAVLGQATGQRELVVGSPMSARTGQPGEPQVGLLINTVALRVDLGEEPTFEALLGRVREVVLDAQEHVHLPFTRVVRALGPPRVEGRNPLFQAIFAAERAELPTRFGALEAEPVPVEAAAPKVELVAALEHRGTEPVALRLEYDPRALSARDAGRLLDRMAGLLGRAAAAPAAPLHRLTALGRTEAAEVLALGSGHPRPGDRRSVPRRIAEAMRLWPERTALRWPGGSLTYDELHRRVAAVAGQLRRMGVGPDRLVGVCLDRGPDLLTAILGVLTAGGAYVPLDPAYPPERIRRTLRDAGAAVITADHLRPLLAGTGVPLLTVDLSETAPAAPGPAAADLSPSGLAHVIYTSGSTGVPKGVAIEHHGVSALADWAARTYPPDAWRAIAATTSVCFDMSVFELLVTLCQGGCVVLLESGLDLAGLAPDADVTLVDTVPSVLQEVLRSGPLPAAVRTVNLGGEPLPPELVAALQRSNPGVRLLNLYGPTEDTTFSTVEEVTESDAAPSIGRPVDGTRVYLLDRGCGLAPLGSTGEVHLAGDGLGRGYLGRPGMTAERFVPDPFAPEPGQRMYRTGDLARMREDGRLDFLGRRDHQVKVRGFRVELGEVESVLLGHGAVVEAVAAVRDEAGGRSLAVFATVGDPAVTGDALRRHLAAALPGYLVPSTVTVVERIPRHPNGKVDSAALLRLAAEADPGADAVVARDPIEFRLSAIWSRVLRMRTVDVHEDFFEAGGDSLMALRLISEVNRSMSLDLRLDALLRAPRIEALAALVRQARPGMPPPLLVPITVAGSDAPLLVVHGAGGHVLFAREVARRLEPPRPVHGLQSTGLYGEAPPLDSIEGMAERYVEAVREAWPSGPYLLAGYCMGGLIAWEMASRLQAAGADVPGLLLMDADATIVAGGSAEGVVESERFFYDFTVSPRTDPPPYEVFRALSEQEQVERVLRLWKRDNFIPPDATADFVRNYMAVSRANLAAAGRYHLGRTFVGPVVQLRAQGGDGDDSDLGWSAVAGELDVVPVSGTHFTMFAAEHAGDLARTVDAVLGRLLPRPVGAV